MRALAVADVYEALTAERPYREALPVERALAIVSSEVPARLDRTALGALEAYLGSDPLAPGVLTLAEEPGRAPLSGARARGRSGRTRPPGRP